MNWFLIAMAVASIGWSFFLLIRVRKLEEKLDIAKEIIDKQDNLLGNWKQVKVGYMETESDILQNPDREKRKKIIRHKIYGQIAQKISKSFSHDMDMERSESGHIIYSYKFLIKRI